MNKKGMGMFTLMFLLFILIIGIAVITVPDFTQDKLNDLKQNLSWNPIVLGTNSTQIGGSTEITNAIEYYVNGLGAAFFELAKWGMQFAYDNPQIPYKLLLVLLLISILAPIIVALVKLLIIIFLLIKEFFQSRNEKRRYKR